MSNSARKGELPKGFDRYNLSKCEISKNYMDRFDKEYNCKPVNKSSAAKTRKKSKSRSKSRSRSKSKSKSRSKSKSKSKTRNKKFEFTKKHIVRRTNNSVTRKKSIENMTDKYSLDDKLGRMLATQKLIKNTSPKPVKQSRYDPNNP